MDLLRWRTHLNPVLAAALILCLVGWIILVYHRQKKIHSTKHAVVLLAPKVLIVILLIFSYFDPVWTVLQAGGKDRKVLIITDCSSSMDVADSDNRSRSKRAGEIQKDIKSQLRSVIDVETLAFDTDIRKAPEKTGPDDDPVATDIGRSLVSLSEREDIGDCLAVVLVTDGGDETLLNIRLPEAPVYIAGVGTDPAQWDDLAIINVDAPEVVEQNADLKIRVDLGAYSATPAFAARANDLAVTLAESDSGNWRIRDTKHITMASQRETVEFLVPMLSHVGSTDYRIEINTVEGELTALNNARQFSVEVRDKTLSVLFYAQQLGWDFSMIRSQLAEDPSVALTALFRITGERFIVQGDRHRGDESLQQGFPADAEILAQYKCIIIGSFPAADWQEEQLKALEEYVRDGGAVIFLGGEHSFGAGGYADTVVAPLLPWRVAPLGDELQTGSFPVTVPVSASQHGIIAKSAQLLAQSGSVMIDSVNLTGQLKTAAMSLLNASVGNREISIVALQRYGKGQAMAIATNTLWKWAKTSETLQQAYGHFWRASVRHMADWQEGGRLLSVKWDANRYSPGRQGRVDIVVGGKYEPGSLHLRAQLKTDDEGVAIPIEQTPGKSNAYSAQLTFAERRNYHFQLDAFLGDELLESYEKTLVIGPGLNEGANLQVDHVFLDDLAKRTGGRYFAEADADKMSATIRNRILEQAQHVEIPLVNDRYIYVIIFLVILMIELTIRRKMNLF